MDIFLFFSFIVIIGGWFWILLVVSRFFVFTFTFLFIVARNLSTLKRIDLSGNLGSQRSRGGILGLLGMFFY